MKTLSALVLTTLATLTLLTGCGGNKTDGLTPAEKQAFDKSGPELKQAWDKALEADKANDFLGAQMLLQSLTASQLTPEQQKAVEKESAAVGQRLMAAAEKGDPAALKAMQELRSGRRR